MREAKTKTAAPSAKGSGGRIEPIGKGYGSEAYRPCLPAAIPSPEDPSRQGASRNELSDCDRRGDLMSTTFRPPLLRLFSGTIGQQAKIEHDFATFAADPSVEVVSVHTASGSAGPSEDRWCTITVTVVYRKVA